MITLHCMKLNVSSGIISPSILIFNEFLSFSDLTKLFLNFCYFKNTNFEKYFVKSSMFRNWNATSWGSQGKLHILVANLSKHFLACFSYLSPVCICTFIARLTFVCNVVSCFALGSFDLWGQSTILLYHPNTSRFS